MRIAIYTLILVVLALVALNGCEVYPQEEFEEEYFIESYLIADQPIEPVLLSATASFEKEYRFEEQAVAGAEIAIYELNEEGLRVDSVTFNERDTGQYYPRNEFIPRPLHDYELQAVTKSRDTLRATTTVPDTFSIARVIRDSVRFQADQQIEMDITQSSYPGRQNVYIFSTKALMPDDYDMTPLYETDDPEERQSATLLRSNIITQGNYDVNEDGTITLAYPWLAVAWFGPNEVTIFALDDNTYDFYRSQDVQLGGNTQAPGQIENVIMHIEGGKGLFGAMAAASFEFYIEPVSFNLQ